MSNDKENSEVDTVAKSEEIANILRKSGIRVKVDSRDIHAGQKYYDWEIKGVPLRLDIEAERYRKQYCVRSKKNRWKRTTPNGRYRK